MSVLLDASVLIALAIEDHVHHAAAEDWFARLAGSFATCPISQGALIRLVVQSGGTPGDAGEALEDVTGSPAHEFWPDDIGYLQVNLAGVVGRRQVTDAYLAALARQHGGHLATFDVGLAALHPDVAVLMSRT